MKFYAPPIALFQHFVPRKTSQRKDVMEVRVDTKSMATVEMGLYGFDI